MVSNKLRVLVDYLEGLTAEADLEALEALLGHLDLTRADLGRGVVFSDQRYQRNVISRSPWHELVCICWKPGQSTPIHDHEGSACAFAVIEGVATERRYELADDRHVVPAGSVRLRERCICAAKDADIHAVHNLEDRELITLHIYSPALSKYNVYTLESQLVSVEVELQTVPLLLGAGCERYDWVI
ncbi:MAG: cysteine dioxygenase family protein [Phycisphaerales bacterium]|nr:cysteine dioxygenase family protein [Phycisphaerales bacterium]